MIATGTISATSEDDVPSSNTASAYRRRARQIRHRFRNDPARLHLSLKSLATRVDAARPPVKSVKPRVQHLKTRTVSAKVVATSGEVADRSTAPIARENRASAKMVARQTAAIASGLQSPIGLVEAFSDRVRASLGEGILRYDQRKALYRDAAELRIDRFEASLIIAAIEHRHGLSDRSTPSTARNAPTPSRTSILSIVAVVLFVEAVIASVATFVLL